MKTTDQLIADHQRQLRALRRKRKADQARQVDERRDAQRVRFAAAVGVDPEDLDGIDDAIASIEAAYSRRAAATAAYDGSHAAAPHTTPAAIGVDLEDLDAMDDAIASIEAANSRRAAATAAYDGSHAAVTGTTPAWPRNQWSASDEIGA